MNNRYNQTKAVAVETCDADTSYANKSPGKCEPRGTSSGDIDIQVSRLSDNVAELERTVTEFISKINPILTPDMSIGCAEKDCNKEEMISPLGTSIRETNRRINIVRGKLLDSFDRIQL